MRAPMLSVALCSSVFLLASACNTRSASRAAMKELALATTATEQLNVAFAEQTGSTMVASRKVYYADADTVKACDDRVDARGWQTVRSTAVDMELPPEFVASSRGRGVTEWRAPDGAYIRVDPTVGAEPHYNWTGLITSECLIYVSGARTHVDALQTVSGLGIHAVIAPEEDKGIAIVADRLTPTRLAELLHAIRSIRVAANWREAR